MKVPQGMVHSLGEKDISFYIYRKVNEIHKINILWYFKNQTSMSSGKHICFYYFERFLPSLNIEKTVEFFPTITTTTFCHADNRHHKACH